MAYKKDGFIYTAYDQRNLDFIKPEFKIGVSRNPEKLIHRLRRMNTSSRMILNMKFIPCDNVIEAKEKLYSTFSQEQISKGWFNLTGDDLVWIFSVVKYENGLFTFRPRSANDIVKCVQCRQNYKLDEHPNRENWCCVRCWTIQSFNGFNKIGELKF